MNVKQVRSISMSGSKRRAQAAALTLWRPLLVGIHCKYNIQGRIEFSEVGAMSIGSNRDVIQEESRRWTMGFIESASDLEFNLGRWYLESGMTDRFACDVLKS